jgi:hypothetical protein
VHALGHVGGEAVDGRALAEDGLEVGRRQRGGVERAEPLLYRERAGEGLLDGDLLVEHEAHEQGHRVRRDQRVGLVGLGEVETFGHDRIVSSR